MPKLNCLYFKGLWLAVLSRGLICKRYRQRKRHEERAAKRRALARPQRRHVYVPNVLARARGAATAERLTKRLSVAVTRPLVVNTRLRPTVPY